MQERPHSTEGIADGLASSQLDPALIPEAPIGLIQKDSTRRHQGGRVGSEREGGGRERGRRENEGGREKERGGGEREE